MRRINGISNKDLCVAFGYYFLFVAELIVLKVTRLLPQYYSLNELQFKFNCNN